LNFFIVHAAIISQLPKNQKPPGGFQARFFLEGLQPRKLLNINGLQGNNSQKIEKTQNKMLFLWRELPVLLPNAVILGSFLAVKLFVLRRLLCKSLSTRDLQGCKRQQFFTLNSQSPSNWFKTAVLQQVIHFGQDLSEE
jgi:hypothetical protein